MPVLTDIKSAETEQLRTKLKKLGDYDEIKRELEIMKVNPISPPFIVLFA